MYVIDLLTSKIICTRQQIIELKMTLFPKMRYFVVYYDFKCLLVQQFDVFIRTIVCNVDIEIIWSIILNVYNQWKWQC